jgi:hypothetical protein
MAVVNKDFKVKNGLIVEGTTATVDNFDILTKKTDDQNYIVNLIGGTATSANEANKVVKRDGSGNFAAGEITADLVGDVTGTVSSLSNHDTDDLSEGSSNKYFTDARAVTANTGLWDTIGAAADAEADAILAAQQYTDGEISDEVIARDAAILLAKNDAIADAASDATTKANAALADANSYTDDEIAAEVTRSNNYADAAATTAENNAKAYADGLSSGLNWKQAVHLLYDAAIPVLSGSGASQLIIDGHDPLGDADSGYRVLINNAGADSGIYVFNSTGGNWTLTRPEDADAFAELVGAAVFVMEGTNYGSTAWVQSEHYLSSFSGQSWTQFSGQGTYLAGNGLTLDGTTFAIDTNVTATKSYADGVAADAEDAAIAHTDAREIAITSAYEGYANGVALTAEQNANIYTDGKIADEVEDRNDAINNAINALTTTDIEEGTNLYYTAARAKAEAATLLANATKTNIVITKDGSDNLTITAENGVADSDTDDLAEGSTNLYFTNARAVSALEAVIPDFDAIDIASVAKQVAATHAVPTASTHTAFAWPHASYRSAEFLVKIAYGTHTDVSKVILTLDTSNNIAITEYAMVGTNGSLGSVSADIDGSNARLRVTTGNNNSTVLVVGTLLA